MSTNKNDWHEVYDLLSWWKKEVVQNASVLVVGAGAIGNEVLKNLALMGVGTIYVIDLDTIEYSNLSRSILFRESDAKKGLYKAEVVVKRLQEINSTITCIPIVGNIGYDVGLGIIKKVDVVIGCLDNRLARLLTNRLCFKVGTPWIDAGIQNLSGQVKLYHREGNCYECNLDDSETEELQRRLGCPDLAKTDIKHGRVPTTPISSSIVAAIQVQEALKLIHGYTDESLGNRMFTYEGMYLDADFYEFGIKNEDCFSHDFIENVIEDHTITINTTVSDVIAYLEKRFGTSDICILLERNPFVSKLVNIENQQFEVATPLSKLPEYIKAHKLRTYVGERLLIPQNGRIERLEKNSPLHDKTLQEIGIPIQDILKIEVGDDFKYIEIG